jgi:hypothetical protein
MVVVGKIVLGGTAVGLLGVVFTSRNFLQDANDIIIKTKNDTFFMIIFLKNYIVILMLKPIDLAFGTP